MSFRTHDESGLYYNIYIYERARENAVSFILHDPLWQFTVRHAKYPYYSDSVPVLSNLGFFWCFMEVHNLKTWKKNLNCYVGLPHLPRVSCFLNKTSVKENAEAWSASHRPKATFCIKVWTSSTLPFTSIVWYNCAAAIGFNLVVFFI